MGGVQPKLQILSNDEIYKIHLTSLDILEKVGVKILCRDSLNLLNQVGAEVDFNRCVAKMPQYLVEECLKKIPREFKMYARSSQNVVNFGDGEMKFMSSGGQMYLVDPIARNRRPGTMKDMINAIRLGDALRNVDIVGAMIVPQDVPIEIADLYMHNALIRNSSKAVFGWIYTRKAARYIIRMFEVLAGGGDQLQKKPMIGYFCEPTSPLQFGANAAEILSEFVKRGLPVYFGPMVMAGATGPATLAGTLALENAEILAGTVLAETIHPHVPVIYGGIPHIMDQRTGNISFGSPEQGIMAAAITQVGKHYGFPVHVNVGLTDSKMPDIQAGIEKAITMLMGILAGAELSGHLGIAGADMGACLEQLVIDDEIADCMTRVSEGFEVDNETLASEIVKNVGIGGTFLTQRHTLKHIRLEYWYPRLCDRQAWDKWHEAGGKDMLLKAREHLEKILKDHQPEPLDRTIEERIDSIVKEAERDMLGNR